MFNLLQIHAQPRTAKLGQNLLPLAQLMVPRGRVELPLSYENRILSPREFSSPVETIGSHRYESASSLTRLVMVQSTGAGRAESQRGLLGRPKVLCIEREGAGPCQATQSPTAKGFPDLAAIEASLDRSQLLLDNGTDVAAMAIDAANSIKAENSPEKMLAHQLAATHKVAMEQFGRASGAYDLPAEMNRLNVALRCMTVFQQGLLALQKLRHRGQQQVTVQYVHVSDGSQAVIGNVENGKT